MEGGGCLSAAHHRGRRLPCGCTPRRLPCGWALGRKARCMGVARTVVRRSSTRRASQTMSPAPKSRRAEGTPTLRNRVSLLAFSTWVDEANILLRNQHILDIGRPTFFFSRVLYSFWERSSVPPLSGRFSQVRAREGGL